MFRFNIFNELAEAPISYWSLVLSVLQLEGEEFFMHETEYQYRLFSAPPIDPFRKSVVNSTPLDRMGIFILSHGPCV